MQTALSERENAQRTGGSGNRLIPDEGSDHIGYSAEFADAPGSELPNTPTHAETGVPADAFNPSTRSTKLFRAALVRGSLSLGTVYSTTKPTRG